MSGLLNWYLRYAPIIALLDAEGADQVLDVGSGWWGLSWYWPHPVVQTDFRFAGSAPTAGRRGRARFVRSSAEQLPFADDSFDFVVSSDMLEHLPEHLRAPSVVELTRVARRGVIVGFPCGEPARQLDRRIDKLLATARRSRPDWLDEHLGQARYPDVDTVADALPGDWEIVSSHPNGGARGQLAVAMAESLPVTRRLAALIEGRLARRGGSRREPAGRTIRMIYRLAPIAADSGDPETM
jgi:SAM-dependent methyltransferase